MGDQYYVDEYDEEPDMDELMGYMSPDEGDGDLAGFERPEMNVDFSTAVVVSNLPQVCGNGNRPVRHISPSTTAAFGVFE